MTTDGRRITFSIVTDATDTAPRALDFDGLDGLEALLHDHAAHYAEKDGPALIGATFDGNGRQDTHATAYHVALLDFDGLPDAELAGLRQWLAGFEHVLHTTASHGDPNAVGKWRPGTHNIRVLMPLAAPMTADTPHELHARVRALHVCIAEQLPGRAARAFDRALWRPGALGYTPRRARPGAPAATIEAHAGAPRLDAEAFDLERVLEARTRHMSAEDAALGSLTGKTVPQRVVDALGHLRAEDYHDWVRFGLALKRSGATNAFDVWAAWSEEADNAAAPGELAEKWNALDCDARAGAIGLGSIIHEAREAGWHDSKPARVMHDPFTGHERRPSEQVQTQLLEQTARDVREGGRYAVVVDTGCGKTYTAVQELAKGLMGEGGETFRGIFVGATKDLLVGKPDKPEDRGVLGMLEDALTRLAEEDGSFTARQRAAQARKRIHLAPTRDRGNCAMLDTYAALRRADPKVATYYCDQCPKRHACPFLEQRDAYEREGVTLMTHVSFVHRFERQGARARAADLGFRLDGAAWGRLLDGDELENVAVTPVARVTDRCLTLSIEVGGEGATPAPELLEGEDWTRGARGRAALTGAGRDVVRQWYAEWGGFEVGTSDDELTAKYERFAALAVDLVTIDENITPELNQSFEITREHMHGMFDAGDLRGERARAALGQALLESEDGRRVGNLSELGLDDFEVTGTTTWLGGLADRALEWAATGRHEDAPRGLDTTPGLEVYDALERAARSGWYGCEIKGGKLHVYAAKHLELGFARTVLYLDATGHEHAARAVLGGGCTIRRHYATRAPGGHVRRVDWDASKSHLKGAHAARRAAVFADRWASGGLLGTHKAHNPDALEDGAEATDAARVADNLELTPLHFGGSTSKGSNAFEDAERIALHTYHCAGVPIRKRAAYYVQACGLEWHDAMAVARWDLEGAPVYQLAHRVRPALYAREITYAAPFQIPGLEPDEVVPLADLDDAIWRASGHTPHHGHGPALRALRRAVEHRGVWVARPDFDGLDLTANPHEHSTPSIGVVPLYTPIEELHPCPALAFEARRLDALANVRTNAARNSPVRLAKLAGLDTLAVKTSAGGGARVLMYTPGVAPGREQVAKALRESSPGLDWFEWEGERVALREPTTVFLMPTLFALHEAGRLERWTFGELVALLRAELGESRAKVRRLIAERGGLEGLKKELDAYRAKMHAPPTAPRRTFNVPCAPQGRWRRYTPPAREQVPHTLLAGSLGAGSRLFPQTRGAPGGADLR